MPASCPTAPTDPTGHERAVAARDAAQAAAKLHQQGHRDRRQMQDSQKQDSLIQTEQRRGQGQGQRQDQEGHLQANAARDADAAEHLHQQAEADEAIVQMGGGRHRRTRASARQAALLQDMHASGPSGVLYIHCHC